MDNLDFKRLTVVSIIGVIIISTLVSVIVLNIATGGTFVGLFGGGRVLIKDAPLGTREVTERVLRQDEFIVQVVEKASSAVVSIVAAKDVPVIEQYYTDPFANDPFFQKFFGGGSGFRVPQYRQKGTERQEVSSGTGFIVSADGIVLTNKHVVEDTKAAYTAIFNDGTKVPAKVLARDPLQDFAILKIQKANLTALTLGQSSRMKIGQSVVAIGNALGEFSNTVSVGIISGLHRNIVAGGSAAGPEELQELIQTDAAINPGNSGGPLLNIYSEVIGINVAVAQGAQGIGFAIPIDSIKRSLKDVQTQGRIIYPFLGVRYTIITPELVEEKKLSATEGVFVNGSKSDPAVVAGSPAEKAGIKDGDIILEISGEKVSQQNPLALIIQKHSVGDEVVLKVLRGTEQLMLRALLAERK